MKLSGQYKNLIRDLTKERDRLDAAIDAIKTLFGRGAPRGPYRKTKTPRLSAAERKAIGRRMSAYWQTRKAEKARRRSGVRLADFGRDQVLIDGEARRARARGRKPGRPRKRPPMSASARALLAKAAKARWQAAKARGLKGSKLPAGIGATPAAPRARKASGDKADKAEKAD